MTMRVYETTLNAMGGELKEIVENVKKAESEGDAKRQMIVNLAVAVLIVLVLIVGFNWLNSTGSTEKVDTGASVAFTEQTYSIGQRLTWKGNGLDPTQKFTVLYVNDETGNAMVVDADGDVWNIAGELKPENAEPTNLYCNENAVSMALTIPESVLENCTEKDTQGNIEAKVDVPICSEGQRLYVSQTSTDVKGYECK